MKTLAELFQLMEITRSQPLYGLVLANVQKHDLSDLAQHHYLVSFMAWQIGAQLEDQGIAVDFRKLLEICMIHDLGELFGGDIAMPYALANPAAKKAATEFEKINQKFLSQYFGNQQERIQAIFHETKEPASLEAVISKVADYMEVTHHKIYIKAHQPDDLAMMENKLRERVDLLSDKNAANALTAIIQQWIKDLKTLPSEPLNYAKLKSHG